MIIGRRQVAPEESAPGQRLSALTMYTRPPEERISVTEFEEYAFDRLRLLSTIETCRAKGLKGPDLEKAIRKARDMYMPLTSAGLVKDHYSHFILRLAYCRSEDLRRWFLQNELELFKWRFQHNPPVDLAAWLAANDLKYEAIAPEEAAELSDKLDEMARSNAKRDRTDGEATRRQDHYKVPFEEVVDLVRQRKVLVRRGFAYVPHSELVSIIATRVRAHLSKQLSTHARAWPALREEESERLASFLEGLATQYVGSDEFSESKGTGQKASLQELPMLARRSMPLCMSNMYSKLTETHHLKHKARNQLGLFLKGIGLTVEESYQVWRGNFTKDPAMTAEKWQKDYAYGIRYNYGLEGKRTNWSPHSCMRIISETGTNPAAGEHHGCPFKTFDEPQLRAQLQQLGVGNADMNFIFEKAKNQHFQVACGKYFEAKHKGSNLIETELGGISHPNQFFDESMKFHAPAGAAAAGVALAADAGSSAMDAAAPPTVQVS